MIIRSLCVLTTLFTFAFSGYAMACSCTYYPFEGTYGSGSEQFTLSYVGQSDGGLPTAIALYARRAGYGLPDANLNLSCEGNSWVGAEPTSVGVFHWIIEGVRNPVDVPPKFSNLFAAAVDFSSDVKLTIIVPPMPMGANDKVRHGDAVARSGASAPGYVCRQIQEAIDGNQSWIDAYGDERILEYATNNNLRSDNNGESLYLDGNGALNNFNGNAEGEYTYEDLVDAKGTGQLTWNGSTPVIAPSFASGSVGAAATTDTRSCEIDIPAQQIGVDNCNLTATLKGTLEHEQSHEALCIKMNGLEHVTSPSGAVYSTDSTLNYSSHTELPANLAADEISAYEADNTYLSDQWSLYGCGPRNDL